MKLLALFRVLNGDPLGIGDSKPRVLKLPKARQGPLQGLRMFLGDALGLLTGALRLLCSYDGGVEVTRDGGFQKLGGPLPKVPVIRIIVYWGLVWGPDLWKLPDLQV